MESHLQALQSDTKERVEKSFHNLIARQSIPKSRLLDAMEYALFNGGKRMRPLLLTLVVDMLDGQSDDAAVASLALECIHAYSLVHDDLPAMDDDAIEIIYTNTFVIIVDYLGWTYFPAFTAQLAASVVRHRSLN